MERVTRVGRVVLTAADPERLAAWYSEHLGIAPTMTARADATSTGQDSPSPELVVVPHESLQSAERCTISFAVSDLAATTRDLQAAGIEVWWQSESAALARDLEGNVIRLEQAHLPDILDLTEPTAGSSDGWGIRTLSQSPPEPFRLAGRLRRNWRAWTPFALVLVGLVVAAIILRPIAQGGGQSEQGTGPSAQHEGPSGQGAVPSAQTAPENGAASADPAVHVSDVGDSLLGISAGWELVVRTASGMARIEFAEGTVTHTRMPGLDTSGEVRLIVQNDRVVIQPLDGGTAYVVPDGKRGRQVGGLPGEVLFAGPQPRQLWVLEGTPLSHQLTLLDADGTPTGVTVPFPPEGFTPLAADSEGKVLLNGLADIYHAGRNGLQKVARGRVLAASDDRLLTLRCDDEARCSNVVVNRANGTTRALTQTQVWRTEPLGVVSPNGHTAALTRPAVIYRSNLIVVNLESGDVRRLAPMRGPHYDNAAAYSPDGQWLFVASRGRLVAYDTRTWRGHSLEVDLNSSAQQLAIRSSGP